MRAVVATGRPDPLAELREVEEPQPREHEALIEVECFSLNRGEVRRLASAEEGWRPGWDVAGTVLEPARDGSGPSAGERVVGFMHLGAGGWAERVAVPTDRAAVLPDGVTSPRAASLPVAGLTALRTLRLGGLLLGRRVLITGAAGGVGRFAIELAAQTGAHITGVVGSPQRAQGLKELGAQELVASIDEAAGWYDLILESVAGQSLAAAFDLVGPAGTIVTFGLSSGQETTVNVNSFYLRGRAKVVGFTLFFDRTPETYADDLGYLVQLVASDRLHPEISVERDWSELEPAMRDLNERRIAGKAVLHVGP
jgi:NADPH2:quinone reductase